MTELIKILTFFTLIEWSFVILSYVSFYFLMERRASKPKIRLRGIILSLIAGILQLIFLISVEVWSMAFLSFTFIFLKLFGFRNCIKEIKEVNKQ